MNNDEIMELAAQFEATNGQIRKGYKLSIPMWIGVVFMGLILLGSNGTDLMRGAVAIIVVGLWFIFGQIFEANRRIELTNRVLFALAKSQAN